MHLLVSRWVRKLRHNIYRHMYHPKILTWACVMGYNLHNHRNLVCILVVRTYRLIIDRTRNRHDKA